MMRKSEQKKKKEEMYYYNMQFLFFFFFQSQFFIDNKYLYFTSKITKRKRSKNFLFVSCLLIFALSKILLTEYAQDTKLKNDIPQHAH
jgi:hypothetical protein